MSDSAARKEEKEEITLVAPASGPGNANSDREGAQVSVSGDPSSDHHASAQALDHQIAPGSQTDGGATVQSVSNLLAPNPGSGALLGVQIPCALSHQILTLVGAGFLCFEFAFLYMYFDRSWFSMDLSTLGLPAILASIAIAHLILSFGESRIAAKYASFILKGKPVSIYRKWITLEEDALCFGIKRIRFDAIDELELSWFGNLIIKSRLVCGPQALNPDVLLKLPFAAASFSNQEKLLSAIKNARPNLVLNKRLSSGRNATWQQGTQVTQLFTAALMTLLLMDVGFSSFYYLELLKNYYLAETDLLQSQKRESDEHYGKAEHLRQNPLALSWVSNKFLNNSSVAAGIWEQRARILWLQGKHDEAIKDSLKAIEEAPTNLRHRLFQTRLLEAENRIADSRSQMEQILEDHKRSLLPRLYILAIAKDRNSDKISKEYKGQLDFCFEKVFENEPQWPPGGNRHFIEVLYSDDIIFLLDRFLSTKYEAPKYSSNPPPSNKE